ncbi:beta strand repeat-containing protein [Candidatus Halobonum tyrrellensis]|uniref:Cell surface glycoprotein n=1 Tax=Candidatus Halobonum tyrrellensis G22 TaxID=1324957 RepID=V4HLS0_9EURY|nr:choice-of-anchor D domain-containing protein [Candidatus Halobonum tyrrellensis]ESP88849.1 cell surface glycoprotein [Candidatus Halobonum tyrrellensis G22]
MTVEFAPTSVGSKQAVLSVDHDAGGSPATVALTGAGTGTAELQVAGDASFGEVAVGETATAEVELTNGGNAPLSVVGAEVVDPNVSAFTVTNAPDTVAANATETVTVEFAPTSVGSEQAVLSVDHDASESPATVQLSGTGVGTPEIRVGGPVSFGEVAVGETATAEVTVENPGTATLSLESATASGAFSVADAPATVAPNGSATVTVRFTPTGAGAQESTLSVDHDAGGSPATVGLSGTGVGTPTVDVQGSLSFGEVSVGETATGTVEVTNGGSAPLSLESAEVTGADAGAFTVTDAPDTVAAGANGSVTVEFAPAGAGARQATLSVAHNASGSPASVALAGTGAGTAAIDVQESLSFGEVSVGGTASEAVTVANDGNVPLSVTNTTVTGPNASAFTVTDEPDTVAAGGTGTVTVEFAPTGAGEHEATLTVEHGGDGSPTTVQLSGTGAGTAELSAPASLAFGTVSVGETAARNVTVENVGTGPLSLTAVTASEAFAVVGDPTGSLAPGEARAVTVEWTPAARSNGSAGTLTLDHDGAGSPATVELSGRAVAGNVSLSAAETARANVTLGSNVTYDVTVRNTGDAAVRVSGVTLADAAPGYAVSNASFDLAPGAERTLAVEFAPEATGERGATVRVSHDATPSPTELRLSATVAQPVDGNESEGGDSGDGGDGSGDGTDDGGDSGDDGGSSDGGSSGGGGGGGGGDGPATSYEVVDLSSGATVTVDEAVTDEPVEADVDVSGAGVTVESLRLAFRFDTADFRIEVGAPTASPESVPALADATPVAYFRAEGVGLNARRLDGATVSLSVSELPAGASPGDVVVYRLVDGSWTPLETTNVGGDRYEVQTDGFTAFAVGVAPGVDGDGANATTGTPNPTDGGTETATAEEAPALGGTETAAVGGGATETTTPGFGASAALVALLTLAGALLLARRR